MRRMDWRVSARSWPVQRPTWNRVAGRYSSMATIRVRPAGTYCRRRVSKTSLPNLTWPAPTVCPAANFNPGARMSDIQQQIHATVTGNPVVLYMKGDARFPQCGFSGTAVQILKACGVENFVTVNVLADEAVRQGIKEYANWPTIPQLYVKGEFIGGCDIMREMYQSGELQELL